MKGWTHLLIDVSRVFVAVDIKLPPDSSHDGNEKRFDSAVT